MLNLNKKLTEKIFKILKYFEIEILPENHNHLLLTLIQAHDTIIQGASETCFLTNLTAYCSALTKIEVELKNTQIIIIKPTKELVRNSKLIFSSISKHFNINAIDIYSQVKDSAGLDNYHVIFSTPGRLLELIQRKAIKVDNLKQIIVDRVEDIFNRQSIGFIEEAFKLILIKIQFILIFNLNSIVGFDLNPLLSLMESPRFINLVDNNNINNNSLAISQDISHYFVNAVGGRNDEKLLIVKELAEAFGNSIQWCIFNAASEELKGLEQVLESAHSKVRLIESTSNPDSSIEGNLDNNYKYLIVNSDNSNNSNNLKTVKFIINFNLPTKERYYFNKINFLNKKLIIISIIDEISIKNVKLIEIHYNIKFRHLPIDFVQLLN